MAAPLKEKFREDIREKYEFLLRFGNSDYGIRYYAFFIIVGMVLSFLTVWFFWRRYKYAIEDLLVIFMIVIFGGVLMSRIWELVWNWKRVMGGNEHWIRKFFNFEGLSIQGALIFVPIFLVTYIKFFSFSKIDLRIAFSLIMPAVFIGQTIGRWGNAFNFELLGKEIGYESKAKDFFIVKLFKTFGLEVFIKSKHDDYFHPAFFYESVFCFVSYVLLVWIINLFSFLKPGSSGSISFIIYGIWRIIKEELILHKEEKMEASSGANWAVISAVIQIVVGVIILFVCEWVLRFEYIRTHIKGRTNYVWKYIDHYQHIPQIESEN